MLRIVKGNLLESQEQYLCHQCNCVTRWAAYIAGDIFQRFPWADVYLPRIPLGYKDKDEPGTIKISGDGQDQRFVVAMFAQVYPGRSKTGYSNDVDSISSRATYFKTCLNKMSKISMSSVAFPWRIGCDAAGGDWNFYMDMIVEFSDGAPFDVVIYKIPGI